MINLSVDNRALLRELMVGDHFLDEDGREMVVTENSQNTFAAISVS